jgi:GGDEF domain-containing protein
LPFLILCPHITPKRLSSLAKQVLEHCRNLDIIISTNEIIHIRCSVGFALTPEQNTQFSPEKTIQLADLALYHAKHNGRDCAYGFLWENKIPHDWSFNRVLNEIDVAFEQKILIKTKV